MGAACWLVRLMVLVCPSLWPVPEGRVQPRRMHARPGSAWRAGVARPKRDGRGSHRPRGVVARLGALHMAGMAAGPPPGACPRAASGARYCTLPTGADGAGAGRGRRRGRRRRGRPASAAAHVWRLASHGGEDMHSTVGCARCHDSARRPSSRPLRIGSALGAPLPVRGRRRVLAGEPVTRSSVAPLTGPHHWAARLSFCPRGPRRRTSKLRTRVLGVVSLASAHVLPVALPMPSAPPPGLPVVCLHARCEPAVASGNRPP